MRRRRENRKGILEKIIRSLQGLTGIPFPEMRTIFARPCRYLI